MGSPVSFPRESFFLHEALSHCYAMWLYPLLALMLSFFQSLYDRLFAPAYDPVGTVYTLATFEAAGMQNTILPGSVLEFISEEGESDVLEFARVEHGNGPRDRFYFYTVPRTGEATRFYPGKLTYQVTCIAPSPQDYLSQLADQEYSSWEEFAMACQAHRVFNDSLIEFAENGTLQLRIFCSIRDTSLLFKNFPDNDREGAYVLSSGSYQNIRVVGSLDLYTSCLACPDSPLSQQTLASFNLPSPSLPMLPRSETIKEYASLQDFEADCFDGHIAEDTLVEITTPSLPTRLRYFSSIQPSTFFGGDPCYKLYFKNYPLDLREGAYSIQMGENPTIKILRATAAWF